MRKKTFLAAGIFLLAAAYLTSGRLRPAAAYVDKDSDEGRAWRAWLAPRRVQRLARLHDYALRGVYPRNLDFSRESTPYFIDAAGTPCAVADLMIDSGEGELARATAARDNHVRVASIVDGPALDWILLSGLLQEEAAMIQPGYNFMHDKPGRRPRQEEGIEIDRVRRHLLAVEEHVRENTELSLDFVVVRLLTRIQADPGFGAGLR